MPAKRRPSFINLRSASSLRKAASGISRAPVRDRHRCDGGRCSLLPNREVLVRFLPCDVTTGDETEQPDAFAPAIICAARMKTIIAMGTVMAGIPLAGEVDRREDQRGRGVRPVPEVLDYILNGNAVAVRRVFELIQNVAKRRSASHSPPAARRAQGGCVLLRNMKRRPPALPFTPSAGNSNRDVLLHS